MALSFDPTEDREYIQGAQSGIAQFIPPRDVLNDVFTPAVRQAWRNRQTEALDRRLGILSACGSRSSDQEHNDNFRFNRAKKAAWETYLFTAFACGLFEGIRGNDLRQRLASRKERDFLAAMAECMVCWFFAGKHKLSLTADAPGRNNNKLDMQIVLSTTSVGVEVKAPYREPPTKRFWHGDDSYKISQAMDTANKQFADDYPNILVLVPKLRRNMYTRRNDLIKASFGQSKITFAVNTQTGESGPPKVRFFPDGRFLNTIKPDGFPAYRRISAILCIEETMMEQYPFPDPLDLLNENARSQIWPERERARDMYFRSDNRAWIEHNILVLHNPCAYHPISYDHFSQYPQLVLHFPTNPGSLKVRRNS